jgi:hypothetical protein
MQLIPAYAPDIIYANGAVQIEVASISGFYLERHYVVSALLMSPIFCLFQRAFVVSLETSLTEIRGLNNIFSINIIYSIFRFYLI